MHFCRNFQFNFALEYTTLTLNTFTTHVLLILTVVHFQYLITSILLSPTIHLIDTWIHAKFLYQNRPICIRYPSNTKVEVSYTLMFIPASKYLNDFLFNFATKNRRHNQLISFKKQLQHTFHY